MIILVNVFFLSACERAQESKADDELHIPLRPFDLKVGTKFTPLPSNPSTAPTL